MLTVVLINEIVFPPNLFRVTFLDICALLLLVFPVRLIRFVDSRYFLVLFADFDIMHILQPFESSCMLVIHLLTHVVEVSFYFLRFLRICSHQRLVFLFSITNLHP